MKVLMFGWEFPPFNSGGLGTACYGITKALSQKGVEINFVIPKKVEISEEFLNIISANLPKTKITLVDSLLTSYMTNERYWELLKLSKDRKLDYGASLVDEVYRYAQIAGEIAEEVDHDVIHCHDWMTLLAGQEARKVSRKPLVSHIHSTEMDRSGGRGSNPEIFEIEKTGIAESDEIIAVSNFTKNKIIQNYQTDSNKIDVIYNAVDKNDFDDNISCKNPFNKKIVLFLGRLTMHKGPDYFLRAAQRVIKKNEDVIFIVSGSGDMERKIIEDACELGIGDKVLFTGFLRDNELKKIYKIADLYVMPSVSEPFGITPLEALASKTPVLISKQSGVSEVLNHCLKVDFWDVEEMANKILAVLENQELEDCLMQNGNAEIDKLTWSNTADKILGVYKNIVSVKI
ncbi:MAG: glycosyltransferase family 4 protein [Candidatus Pacebacteria bacterium]|nr:glycosyltransferase family 4 protein [Candidatus Paceibacterota bacterium]